MSTLGKIIGFIVLVCSVAVLMATWVLKEQATNWKADYYKLETQKNDEIDVLKKEVGQLTANLEKAEEDRDKWQRQVDDKITTIGKLDIEIGTLNSQIRMLESWKKRLEDNVAGIRNQLELQRKANETLSAKKEAARIAKETAEKDMRDAQDELTACQEDLTDLRNQLQIRTGNLKSAVDLNERYGIVYGVEGVRQTAMTETPPPKINGQVVRADNNAGIVMISVGKDDGVTDGMRFEVVRTAARAYVGRVRVTNVYDEESICRVILPMTPNPIREGDYVTTRLK